jgi:hypothetical protein
MSQIMKITIVATGGETTLHITEEEIMLEKEHNGQNLFKNTGIRRLKTRDFYEELREQKEKKLKHFLDDERFSYLFKDHKSVQFRMEKSAFDPLKIEIELTLPNTSLIESEFFFEQVFDSLSLFYRPLIK